ncbi:hypothetical protein NVP1199A_23 [Vibrio phage 1.199.A._10N.286.55.C10]|nr:hypothetical protein NVP1199A_23 [Vibrio phage 1.199.A._10N.286.55.C10]AUR94966.1 hypothetical protein NVP1199B_23 [Vibrio phage 1.199.B._10N.286.55.C10]
MIKKESTEIGSILALFKSEGLDPCSFDECTKSLSETCLPTRLTETYIKKIYPTEIEARDLGADFERLMQWRGSV